MRFILSIIIITVLITYVIMPLVPKIKNFFKKKFTDFENSMNEEENDDYE